MFEKKRGKRFLASVMALVMLLSLAPVGALAAKGGNGSYPTEETLKIEDVETPYKLSGQSNSGFTEARYIWETGNTVYLAFTVNYGNNEKGGKPILTATVPNGKTLEVGTTLYTNLQFGDNEEIHANGKKANTLWQIATYTGSIQDLLNEDNKLIISTQNQGGGHQLNATYTVEDYPDPSEPGEGGEIPSGPSGDGDQQGTNERLYIAIIQGDPTNLTLPQEPGFSTDYRYYFVQNNQDTYSLTEWSDEGPVFSDDAGSYVNVSAFNNAERITKNNNNGGTVTGIFAEDGINLTTYFSTTISEANIISAYLNKQGITGDAEDYKLVPYVLKYEDYSSEGYEGYETPAHGYHLDCYIIKKNNVKVTYNTNLNGATTGYTVPESRSVEKGTKVTISKWTKGSTEANDSDVTATKDGKIYAFKGWSTTPSEPAEGSSLYVAGNNLTVDRNITLYAIWQKKEESNPNPPTDTVDAKYFVLMPSANAPSSGKDQGKENYFPSERKDNGQTITDDGGVDGASRATGYAGKITQGAADLVKNKGDDGYFDAKGVEDTYLAQKPIDLGYFDTKNYNQTTTPWGYTGYGNLPATLTAFTMEGKEVVWYVIKNVGTETKPDYHVDGYVKGVDIEVKYHQNFTEGTSWTQTGLQSGNTVKIKDYATVWPDSSRTGYTFTGWNTKEDGTGESYVANSEEVLKTSIDLYAQWEQNYTVIFDANGGKWGTNTSIEGYEFNTGKTTATSGTLFASSIVSPVVTPTNGQKNFLGWAASSDSSNLLQLTNPTVAELKNWTNTDGTTITLYAIWENNPVQYTYNIHQHFKNSPNDANDIRTVNIDGDLRAEQSTLISTLIVDQEANVKPYVYVASDTKVNGGAYNSTTSRLTQNDTRIDLYYYLDNWKDVDNTSGEDTDSETGGDGIPDCQQVKIQYLAYKENGGTVSRQVEIATFDNDVLNTIHGSTAMANSGFTFVTWSGKDVTVNDITVNSVIAATEPKSGAECKPSSAELVKGNAYTYTAIFLEDKIGDRNDDGTDKGDGIPDRYQVTINYVTDNTGRGQITGLTKEVKTIYANGKEGKWASTGKVTASGSTAEATGSRNYFSNWTNKDNTQVSTSAASGKLPFDAVGGETYTFTANFYHRSGGGSSRPSTPTVTIPDNVPTGLNGTDHYAYIIGYGNNDVRPQNNITRAEVATIFFRLLTDETREANMTKSNGYNDVKDGDWFCCAVSTLSKMGIIKGYEDGSFKPNAPISRAEFAAIAARFDPDGDKTPASFADVTSHWAKDEISIAANHGWIKGYEDGSFKPDQKITRAETMTLVNRVLNRLPETKDDLHKDMKTWVDNMDETAWYYLAVQEATNSHYFKNKTGTKFEQWTDLRDTRDWSELEK